jgi:hypothetical protein
MLFLVELSTSGANPTQIRCRPFFVPIWHWEKKKDSRVIAVSPLFSRCPGQESNLHALSGTRS